MTLPSTHIFCARTATPGLTGTGFIPALALFAIFLALPAAAQTPAPMDSTATPPSGVTQTAPAPAPPPQKVTPEPTPEGSTGPTSAEPEVTAFDIAVRAPQGIKELLERHLELQRYRAVTDLDEAELARLVVLAERNVRNLVGTLGYFSPNIAITKEGAAGQHPTIVVAVDPGEPTAVGAVDITFAGDIAESADPGALSQRADIQRDWRLPTGRRFTQDAWDSAKTQALRDLVARRYPAGKLAGSLADIDAPARTAGLSLKLDSGPLYRLGPMQITGVERYDPVLVPRLARLTTGAVYDQNQLVEAQQRLASSGYFDSAYIFVDPESDPLAAPVQVQVREAKLQKIVLGVGVTTDSGPRASVEHTHLRVPGTNWRAATKLQIEKKSPFAQTEWTSIPDESNWRWVALARTERVDDNELVTRSGRLRFGRTQAGERIDRNVYLQYDRASVSGSGQINSSAADVGDGSALTANYVWTGRYFDSLIAPNKGYGLGFELGGGSTMGSQHLPLGRAVGRWLGIVPLERGRIAMRAEGGAVVAKDSARIPGTLLFRTGGDTTVRGYGYRDIGIKLDNGVTGPGRYMAVGSVEYQRPMLRDGRPSEWENTFFIDAGAVADNPKDMKPSIGIGTGVRWRSPIGPLQIDLAYGEKVKQVRLHVSVGFVF
ncbi:MULTISPECIES: autotransporter assembly complex family protein [unclassified Polaromonas]|uniref:autotransporter assembly complex protein TamA n=1 Tax=unclassified Polaromonas TaxID=2638319 RepID=UPI001E65980D|nr:MULTISPECIES: BamA/TamA family outer membrane protein [unclassified Polaromonas]